MENFTPQELLALWKKGKTLFDSLFEFTSPEFIKEYNDRRLFIDKNNERMKEYQPSATETKSEGVLNQLGTTLHLHVALDLSFKELKSDLLNKIISEKIIGLGYEAPIKASDTPQILPIHIWPQSIYEINWNDSSISKNGNDFQNIRIVKKSAIRKTINKPIKEKKPSPPNKIIEDKKVGRPSLKDEITEAYEYLKEHKIIDFSKKLISQTGLIQDTVRLLHTDIEDNKGMQYEVIRRTIGKQYEIDKKSSKL